MDGHSIPRRYKQRKRQDVAIRFWSKVRKTNGCWLWQASTDKRGYGRFGYGPTNQPKFAHRVAWALTYGVDPPADLCVCHRCDTPACVNPAHLFLGTKAENNADCYAKGRRVSPFQDRSKLTPEQVTDLIARSRAGARVRDLTRAFGIHSSSVIYHLRRAGIPPARRPRR